MAIRRSRLDTSTVFNESATDIGAAAASASGPPPLMGSMDSSSEPGGCSAADYHSFGLLSIDMGAYLDDVPLSGIIRIRDMMYSVADPFRLDQGDVSFDAPDSVKSAMARAIAENKSHYLQTTGVPRLRELIAAKLREKNGIPVNDPED